MSVSGISSGCSGSVPSISQQIQDEFQQLGKDLQSGDITAAQADYVTLQEDLAKRAAEDAVRQPQVHTQSTSTASQATQPAVQAASQSNSATSAQAASQPDEGFILTLTLTESISNAQSSAAAQSGTVSESISLQFSNSPSSSSQSGTSSPDSASTQAGNPIAQEYQQLGKDLQAGNLTAAQTDFTTLQQDFSQTKAVAPATTQSTGAVAAAFNQLSQDLQSGNLKSAQQDFATIQQDLQSQVAQSGQSGFGAEGHRHEHDDDGDSGSGASSTLNAGPGEVGKLLKELGKELQSGNLSSAQSTYTSLEQDFQEFSQSGRKVAATVTQFSQSSLSVSA